MSRSCLLNVSTPKSINGKLDSLHEIDVLKDTSHRCVFYVQQRDHNDPIRFTLTLLSFCLQLTTSIPKKKHLHYLYHVQPHLIWSEDILFFFCFIIYLRNAKWKAAVPGNFPIFLSRSNFHSVCCICYVFSVVCPLRYILYGYTKNTLYKMPNNNNNMLCTCKALHSLIPIHIETPPNNTSADTIHMYTPMVYSNVYVMVYIYSEYVCRGQQQIYISICTYVKRSYNIQYSSVLFLCRLCVRYKK